jgi:hypothetical protein
MKDIGFRSIVQPDMSIESEAILTIRHATKDFLDALWEKLPDVSPYDIENIIHGLVSTESAKRIIYRRRTLENK